MARDAFSPHLVEGKGCSCGHPRFVQMVESEPQCPILAEVASREECSKATASFGIGNGSKLYAYPRWASFCSVKTSGKMDMESRWNPFPPNDLQGNSAGYARPVCRGGSYYLQDMALCPAGHEIVSVEECRAALALVTGRAVSRYRLQPAKKWSCHLEQDDEAHGTDSKRETAVFSYIDIDNSTILSDWQLGKATDGAVCRTDDSTTIVSQAVATLEQPWISTDTTIPAMRRLSATGLIGANRSQALVPFLLHRGFRRGFTHNATEYEQEWEAAVEAIGVFFSNPFVDTYQVKRTIVDTVREEEQRNRSFSEHEVEFFTEELTRVGRSSQVSRSARTGARELRLLIANWSAYRDMEEMRRAAAEVNVSTRLTSHVGKPISVDGNHTLMIPPGIMVLPTCRGKDDFGPDDYMRAHRCPNARACPGVNITIFRDLSYCMVDSNGFTVDSSGSCEQAYDQNSKGCAKCASEAGRSPTDGFRCKPCGEYYKHVMRHTLLPLALFLFGMKSAHNPAPAECFGSFLTVFLSFHSTASLVLSAIVASPIGTTLAETVGDLLSFSTNSASGASGMPSGSIDCLLGEPAGIRSWLLLSAAVPVTIFVLWVVGAVAWYYFIRGEEFKVVIDTTERELGVQLDTQDGITLRIRDPLADLVQQWNDTHPGLAIEPGDSIVEANGIRDDMLGIVNECNQSKKLELVVKRQRPTFTVIIMQPMAVFVKCFLPMILMVVCRAWPCFHTQVVRDGEGYNLMYNVDAPCPGFLSQTGLLCLCGAILCCVLGPGLWLHITLRPESWGDDAKKAVWGVLMRPYRDGCQYWEVVMLVRRMALASLAALCPISYSCQTQLKGVLMINVLALGAHGRKMPYEKEITQNMPRGLTMNRIELYSLITSCTSTLLVAYATEGGWTHYDTLDLYCTGLAISLMVAFSMVLLVLLVYTGSNKLQGFLQGGLLSTLAAT